MTSNTLRILLISIAWMCLYVPTIRGQGAPPEPAVDLVAGRPSGPWRRLFLDAMVVERRQGLERVFHSAEKHPGNPVLRKDRPWEGTPTRSGPYLYGTVMWDGGRLRMWYHCYAQGYVNCYAESTDGITWTKPSLGLIEYGGSTDNNLFLAGSETVEAPDVFRGGGRCHNPSVIKRPWEDDAEKRYALFCYAQEYRHARVAFSPDGLRWTFVPETARKALFGSSDVLNFFHDPYRDRYVCTLKSGNRRGRAAGVATSRDGLTWEKPVAGPVFVADDLDPDATQVYGMPVFPYQGLYIGIPWIYNSRWFKYGGYTDKRMYEVERGSPCTIDAQLAWSWDLVNWTRAPQRKPLIPRGRPGEFDSDMIYTARAPVQMGEKLYFYYGGFNEPHNSTTYISHIGLATLRIDGFCSMRAGADEGWFITRRERFCVPRVTINARVRAGGHVVAEVLDRDDRVIPGFSRDECRRFTGDSIAHQLAWGADAFPEEHRGPDKKIRFFLREADLFSYLPDQTVGPVVVLYDPSANGGLLADDEGIPEHQRFGKSGVQSGFTVARAGGRTYLDLHSVAEKKTNASYWRDGDWTDDTDWCVEAWYRVIDQGTEPNYGLATWMRPDSGRNAAIYMSESEVGINSTSGLTRHVTLKKVPMDTTDGFHWYRLAHSGGPDGVVVLYVDGVEATRVGMSDLFQRAGRGHNIGFGPNAGHCEGRMHVAKFGYRVGGTGPLLGPVPDAAPP